ncbi:MAG: UDP-N-acetylmuramate dehydrogenase [Clostridia bacterium]
MDANLLKEMHDSLPDSSRYQEDLSQHTTWKIGGKAECIVFPSNISEIVQTIEFCKTHALEFSIIGNGSNILFRDKTYPGVIIQLTKNFNHLEINNSCVKADAGVLLAAIAMKTKRLGLTGFEYLSLIPGSVGAAVIMNAGSHGLEISKLLKNVIVLNENNNIEILASNEIIFSHRFSSLSVSKYILLQAEFQLEYGLLQDIETRQESFLLWRKNHQPISNLTAGSVFKYPSGTTAGKLIDNCGLRGLVVGNAKISLIHANFIENLGGATAKDVLNLIYICKACVWEKFAIQLETEVKII